MRKLNNHIKEIMGIKEQPKPSANPKNWNWTAIIVWSVMGTVAGSLANFLYNLIF